jgi:hypothetical protein
MTKPPRTGADRIDTVRLVESFLASATSEFSTLVAATGASWSVSLEHSRKTGLVPVAPEDIAGFFFATGAFDTSRVAGKITFGDREFYINAVLGPSRGPERYGLWEWADALGYPDLVPRETDFVLTVPRLEAIVAEMARAVGSLEAMIVSAPATIVAGMDEARRVVQASFQARLAQDDHRRVSSAASVAFSERDFVRVVALLLPFELVLTPAERKKLAYARAHL